MCQGYLCLLTHGRPHQSWFRGKGTMLISSAQSPFWHSAPLFIFISASLSEAEHIPYCAILTRLGSLRLGTIDVLFSLGWTKKSKKQQPMTHKHMMGLLCLLPGPRDKVVFFWTATVDPDSFLVLTSAPVTALTEVEQLCANNHQKSLRILQERTFQSQNHILFQFAFLLLVDWWIEGRPSRGPINSCIHLRSKSLHTVREWLEHIRNIQDVGFFLMTLRWFHWKCQEMWWVRNIRTATGIDRFWWCWKSCHSNQPCGLLTSSEWWWLFAAGDFWACSNRAHLIQSSRLGHKRHNGKVRGAQHRWERANHWPDQVRKVVLSHFKSREVKMTQGPRKVGIFWSHQIWSHLMHPSKVNGSIFIHLH